MDTVYDKLTMNLICTKLFQNHLFSNFIDKVTTLSKKKCIDKVTSKHDLNFPDVTIL